jgi:hypothetical protein
MFLNIKNTGTPINSELAYYIETNFEGIAFNQIYISGLSDERKLEEHDITYVGFQNNAENTICIDGTVLNQNIIDWLNTL